MTPRSPLWYSRKSAAFRVGVVTDEAVRNTLLAVFHDVRTNQSFHDSGIVAKSRIFSAITWFVPTMRMLRLVASRARPRPITMWDWKCTTSGFTASSTLRARAFAVHGSTKRSQSCGYQRQLAQRCTVMSAPSMFSVNVPVLRCVFDGATMCTSWPRATSPAARRSAKRAAPLMSG